MASKDIYTDHYFRKFPRNQAVLHVRFHITKEYYLRKWIATKLIALAAWIVGVGIEVNDG
jgi:hypothetical protein